jgi:hypothetical protein
MRTVLLKPPLVCEISAFGSTPQSTCTVQAEVLLKVKRGPRKDPLPVGSILPSEFGFIEKGIARVFTSEGGGGCRVRITL